MRTLKIGSLLKLVGGFLLAAFVFLLLSLSDTVRLYDLGEVKNAALSQAAHDQAVAMQVDALVPQSELTEGMETNFSQNAGQVALPENPTMLQVNGEDYQLYSLDQFKELGGKLSTDKFKAVKTLETEGAVYGIGTIQYTKTAWESMDGWHQFLVTVAPVLNPLAILSGLAVLAGLFLGMMGKAAVQGISVMKYLGDKFAFAKIRKFIMNNIIIIFILLFAGVVAIMKPTFAGENSIRNLLSNTAVRFIIALGVSGCLITKGTDLSAGRVAGLAACLSGILLQRADYSGRFYTNLVELPIPVVLLIVLGVCAVIGLVNGSVIAFFKVPPFIATLGMQTLVYGVCLVYTGAIPIGGIRQDYTQIATGYVGNQMISYILLIAVAIGALMWFLYNKTRHGKYMYAIGGNEIAAEVAGINTNKRKILIYMLAAILYGVMGFLSVAKSGGASVNTAQGYELEAIAGCTIGGVSVNGGVGKISGILIGVLVFEVLKIALQFLGVEPSLTYVVQGLVIITAVALDLRKYLAKK
jgi:methyl-galactoside transport system permease protein